MDQQNNKLFLIEGRKKLPHERSDDNSMNLAVQLAGETNLKLYFEVEIALERFYLPNVRLLKS